MRADKEDIIVSVTVDGIPVWVLSTVPVIHVRIAAVDVTMKNKSVVMNLDVDMHVGTVRITARNNIGHTLASE